MTKMYLVCEHVKITEENRTGLEIIGVFSTKEKAIRECLTGNYFWGEFELDKAMHENGVKWPTKDPYPIKQSA